MAALETTLNNAIQAADEWKPERAPYTLELYLFELNGANQSKHKDLWAKFRTALAKNTHLKNKASSQFFDRPFWAKEGWWWWNPDEWTVSDKDQANS